MHSTHHTGSRQAMRPKDGSRYIGHYGKRNDPTRTRQARAASKARKEARRAR